MRLGKKNLVRGSAQKERPSIPIRALGSAPQLSALLQPSLRILPHSPRMSPRTRRRFALISACFRNPVVEGAFPQRVPTTLVGGPVIARPWRPAMSVAVRTGRRIAMAGEGDSVVVRARRAEATPAAVVVVVVRATMMPLPQEGAGKRCGELNELRVSLDALGGTGGCFYFGGTGTTITITTGGSARKCDSAGHCCWVGVAAQYQ